jgi:hypothetical protein
MTVLYMEIFRKKYNNYINFKEFFSKTINYRLNKEFIYNSNKTTTNQLRQYLQHKKIDKVTN